MTAQSGVGVKTYVNGVLIASASHSGSLTASGNVLRVGANTMGAPSNYFTGKIDEVRIWSRALCQAEIASQKDCELSGSVNGLVAYYKFNQGIAGANNAGETTLTDASGNANHGTLIDFALSGSTSNWVAPGGITSGNSCPAYNAPEINLQGNSNSIPDGTTSTSSTNFTALGNAITGIGKSRSFTIQNTGIGTLTVSSISFSGTNPADFSASGISLPATISASGSATFNVLFNPSSAGSKTATINIVSDDCDEGNYDFALSGTGTTAFTFSSNSDWATAANWDVEVVPTTANLTSGRSVVIAQSCTMNDVTVSFASGTSLTVNSSRTLSPRFNTYITIASGATLTVQASGSMSQGRITNSGTMNISGSYTAFYMTNNSGGIFNVLSGGSYTCPSCAETFSTGGIINNSGTMNVGTASTWNGTINNNSGGTITDGGNGAQIQLGASSTLNNYGSFVSRTAGTEGVFNNYSTGTLTMPGTCNFTIKNNGNFSNAGNLTAGNGDNFLNVQAGGILTNTGTMTINGSMVVSAGGMFSNNGTYKGSGSYTTGLFTNPSNGIVAPGNSPGCSNFGNGFTNDGTVQIELGGTTACTAHDKINLTGTATLDGTLTVSLINGYIGTGSDQATIIQATAVSGTFSSVSLPANWFINYTPTAVILSYNSVLPVDLVRFTGRETAGGVLLQWQTASEQNNEGFHIERSTDGHFWENIGFVAGHGTTTEKQDYSMMDEKPLPGINYYRLRQTDFDGKEELSKVVGLDFRNLEDFRNLKAYPNPVSRNDAITLYLGRETDELELLCRLFDGAGKLVKMITLPNEEKIEMEMEGILPGVYWLEVIKGEKRFFERLVVQ